MKKASLTTAPISNHFNSSSQNILPAARKGKRKSKEVRANQAMSAEICDQMTLGLQSGESSQSSAPSGDGKKEETISVHSPTPLGQ